METNGFICLPININYTRPGQSIPLLLLWERQWTRSSCSQSLGSKRMWICEWLPSRHRYIYEIVSVFLEKRSDQFSVPAVVRLILIKTNIVWIRRFTAGVVPNVNWLCYVTRSVLSDHWRPIGGPT